MRQTRAAARRTLLLLVALIAAADSQLFAQGEPAKPPAKPSPKTSAPKTPEVSEISEVGTTKPVTGIVLDPAGAPVAGCKVWMFVPGFGEGPPAADVSDQAVTDSQGRFAFRNAKPVLPPEGSDWMVLFARDARGFIGGREWPRHWPPLTVADKVRIRLVEVRTYQGRIEDSSGKPIVKARIQPYSLDLGRPGFAWSAGESAWLPSEVAKEMATESGPDGTFVVRGVPAVGRISTTLSAAGFGSFNADWCLNRPTTFRLARAGSVRGSLICEGDSKAIAGVWLRLNQATEWPSSWCDDPALSGFAETTTQKDGTFLFAEVPSGKYTIGASFPDDFPYYVEPGRYVELKPQEVASDVSVKLGRTVPVHGTVVDATSGEGIQDVELSLWETCPLPEGHETFLSRRRIRTDARGAYSARTAPGKVEVQVERVPEQFTRSWDRIPLPVDRGKDAAMPPIRLKRAWSVEGIVVDESGKPLARAEIVPSGARVSSAGPFRSDRSGKFTVKGIEAGESVKLAARTETAAVAAQVTVHPGGGPTRLVVSEKNAFRLRGRVVDETGRPVRGAVVWLDEWGWPAVECDAQGRYEFRGLWPGAWWCYLSGAAADGYVTYIHNPFSGSFPPRATLRGKPGEVHDLPKIVLLSLRGTVEGTVVDSAGKPLADVMVFNSGGAPEVITTRTDAAGRFHLEGLLSGAVFVFAAKPDYRFTGMITKSGASGVVVKLLRRSEPVPPWPRPVPPSYEEHQDVARRCLVKVWEVADDPKTKEDVIKVMGRIDLEQARKWSLASEGLARHEVQRMFIEKAADKDLDEAIKRIGWADDDDGVDPWVVLAALGRRYAASDPVKATRCAEKMATLARQSDEIPERLEHLARAGGLAMRLGKKDSGRKWIEEAARLIPKSEDRDGFEVAQCEVAKGMASYDLGRAVRLLNEVEDRNLRQQYLPRLAIAGCVNDLERSLDLLKEIEPKDMRDPGYDRSTRVRIACRLAATRPERALKLVEGIPSEWGQRASAYGQLAVAIAPRNKALAWSLIDRALPTGLERVTGSLVQEILPYQAAELAVQARQIGYPDMKNAVWRVVACLATDVSPPTNALVGWGALALADPETARDAFEGFDRRAQMIHSSSIVGIDYRVSLGDWALADLKHAEELFERELANVKKIKDPSERADSLSSLLGMTEVLAIPPSERPQYLGYLHAPIGLRPPAGSPLPEEDED